MINLVHVALIVFTLIGCTSTQSRSMPYEAWRLGFSAPVHMEVWIESADVIDIQGQVYKHAMSGNAAIIAPSTKHGDPRGWPKKVGWGKGKYVRGADLPQKIYVRWQSLAEPRTYRMVINIPESTRRLMRKGEKAFCTADGKWIIGYHKSVAITLVPGGIAKV